MPTQQATRLAPQQEAFVVNYITNGGDGTQAAIDAGYSPANARFQASRLLAKANISQQIARKQAQLAVRHDYSVADWLKDVLSDIDEARRAGARSAVMKGHELVGRHLGALSNDGPARSAEERDFWRAMGAVATASRLPQPTVIDVSPAGFPTAEGDGAADAEMEP